MNKHYFGVVGGDLHFREPICDKELKQRLEDHWFFSFLLLRVYPR